MLTLLAIPLMAALNHIRGGGPRFHLAWLLDRLPGRPGWYCVPGVAATGLLCMLWPDAIWWALAWLWWTVLPWGRWYRPALGIVPHADGKYSPIEQGIEVIGCGNADACFLIRNVIGWLPAVALSPWFLLLAPLQGLTYRAVQKLGGDIAECELLFGALTGFAMILYGSPFFA